MCEYDENDTDENIIDESESRSTKFMTNQIARLACYHYMVDNQ